MVTSGEDGVPEGRRDALQAIAVRWHGIWMTLPAGQVLVYAGHLPTGVHVVARGAFDAFADASGVPTARLDASAAPLVLPPPTLLDTPAEATLSIVKEAEILFLPRHRVLREPELRRALEEILRPAP